MTDQNHPTFGPANGKALRVAIYLRVSTRDGRQETDNQRLQLCQLCKAQGWEIAGEYEDQDSGGKSDRSRFQTMLRDAATRKFDLLLFWALDRFSREGTLATLKYLELLESYGVRWRSFTEPWIDSAGPFRAWIAETPLIHKPYWGSPDLVPASAFLSQEIENNTPAVALSPACHNRVVSARQ